MRGIKLSGYVRVERPFSSLRLTGDYVAIREHLDRDGRDGLVVPPASHAVFGTVLATAPLVPELVGIREGDVVLYAEWQGGRWAFLDPESDDGVVRCLIMSSDYVLARLEAQDVAD